MGAFTTSLVSIQTVLYMYISVLPLTMSSCGKKKCDKGKVVI